MKITFIMPNIGRMEHSLYVDEGRMEPLPLGVLAGLTPPEHQCVLYDDRMEEIPYDEPTDLVAMTVEIYKARRTYEIAAEYRRRGVPVILGGIHATLVPDECQGHADSVFVGDAETGWHQVLADLQNGGLKPRYDAPVGVAQEGGVLPRRDLYEGKNYLPISLMQYSRGCRFPCDFCVINVYFGRKNYQRTASEVLREIERQNRKFVFFVDDNFLSDHEAAKSFLRELIPMKIRWVSQASLNMTRDPELMELLVASGCAGNVIGFESIVPASLKGMRKAPNLIDRNWDTYDAQVQILRDHKLCTWAAFTLGHDHDTVASIEQTYEFAVRNRFCFSAFNILMPYPKTPLYSRLQKEGRLLWNGQWWLHPEYRFNHAAFVPKKMSPDELTEACWQCRYKWNKFSTILYRLFDFKTHLGSLFNFFTYMTYNPIYSKEAYKKQGMLFGLDRNSVRPAAPAPLFAAANSPGPGSGKEDPDRQLIR